MKPVIASLMAHKQPNKNAAGYSNGQANNVNGGKCLVLFDVPESDLQMIFKHNETTQKIILEQSHVRYKCLILTMPSPCDTRI
jgi:hypothetical protein